MIYILIFVIVVYDKPESQSLEFTSLVACQAVVSELRRQSSAHRRIELPVVLCAAKGAQP